VLTRRRFLQTTGAGLIAWPSFLDAREHADLGLHSLLKRHAATVQRVISGHWHRWVDRGREFGPPHLVIAATRYDADAYLIVEIDTKAGSHRLLNLDLIEWNTHFSHPYVSA
jgi:hypothetical protein